MTETSEKLIKVLIPKGLLLLTEAEFLRALKRGKVVKRSERQRQREEDKWKEYSGNMLTQKAILGDYD